MLTVTVEQLSIWLGILAAIVTGVWAVGRVLISQFAKQLATRFAAQDERFDALMRGQEAERGQFEKQLAIRFSAQDERFDALMRGQEAERGNWQRIERDLLELKADLPVAYVRREDYVRGQTVIEAKLDAIHSRIENVQIKVAQNQGHRT